MSFNEKFYNELLASGLKEETARIMSVFKVSVKKKNSSKGKFFSNGKEEYEMKVHFICATCKHKKSLTRIVNKPMEDQFATVSTCDHCADFLLDKLTHKQLVTITILENHPEDTLSSLALPGKIRLADEKSALDWLLTTFQRTSNIRDKDEINEEVKTKPKEKVKEITEEDKKLMIVKLLESGINEELAKVMLNINRPKPQAKRIKTISKKDIVITKTCATCGSKVSFKKTIETVSKDDLYQACSLKLCDNCLKMFESMTSEQLVSLIIIQNSHDIEIRILPAAEQIKLALHTDYTLAYSLHN